MSATPLLKIEHLEVRYGDLIGVADVSLEVPKGSVVALLGSNGAGKTTTLNAIAGIARVAAGKVTFAGEDLAGVGPGGDLLGVQATDLRHEVLLENHSARSNGLRSWALSAAVAQRSDSVQFPAAAVAADIQELL